MGITRINSVEGRPPMNRDHVTLLVILVTASAVLPAAAQRTVDVLGRSGSGSECACPKEGRWKVQNLEGWMNCTGPINLKRKLKEVKDKGTIWVLEKDCSSLFGEASKKKDEDVVMDRVEGCGYEGTINGEEDGIKMVIDVTWVLEGDELIKGEMHSNPSLQGMTCEYYRPFEITFDEALREDEYPKLKKKMEKKLKEIRGKD
jgi:hypothetical protein